MLFGVEFHDVTVAVFAEDQINFFLSRLTAWKGCHGVLVHFREDGG